MAIVFTPNWRDSVQDTYVFSTVIFVSSSGKETRAALRRSPRMAREFTALMPGDNARAAVRSVYKADGKPVAMANFMATGHSLANAAPKGTIEIYITGSPTWLSDGEQLFITHGFRQEAVTHGATVAVSSFSYGFSSAFGQEMTHVILQAALDQDWPEGASVFPAIYGNAIREIELSHVTTDVVEGKIEFELTPGTPVAPSFVPAKVFGEDFFSFAPNWARGTRSTLIGNYESLDYDSGVVATYRRVDFDTRKMQFDFLMPSKSRAQELIDFFLLKRGRQGEFFCQSWCADMRHTTGVAAGEMVIRVHGRDVAQTFADDTVHRALAVTDVYGNTHCVRVAEMQEEVVPIPPGSSSDMSSGFSTGFGAVSYGELGNQTRITLRDPFPVDLGKKEIDRISWLYRCRFTADTLSVDWETDSVASATIGVTTIEFDAS